MKKPQWITLFIGILLVAVLFRFGKTVPDKKPVATDTHEDHEAHEEVTLSIDSILARAKKQITPEQATRLNELENSVIRGDVKDQKIRLYHHLAGFWKDSALFFEPYAWYEAEAARLENSEKSLTFAAHLFLQNLRGESRPVLRRWKALVAKDLFERSLIINPDNDSSKVGLGACYIFGEVSSSPMEGIQRIVAVTEKDSTNVFAQEVLGQGAMMTGQYDKAITRFEMVYRHSEKNVPLRITACWIIAEAYEKKSNPALAVEWYRKSLSLLNDNEVKAEVQKRIDQLNKK